MGRVSLCYRPVAAVGVLGHGRDPNRVRPNNVLDVVEIIENAPEAAAAVVSDIATGRGIVVGTREAVGEELIDRAGGPVKGGGSPECGSRRGAGGD